MIPYGKQSLSQSDIDAVETVLRSDFLTQGECVPRFESALCQTVGAAHAVAVNSGTSALHIACLALGLGPGDTLWTSPISFVASANCALYCGAQVDFVDIDPRTNNISVEVLEQRLIAAKKANRLPKVLVPVHLAGQPCEMAAIKFLAQKYGFSIIEDASHALGARYAESPIGACKYSDITVFSFHPVKIITTGEGGAALTNSPELAKKMQAFRSHGITRDVEAMTEPSHGPWYYQQQSLGFNYRMSDIHAALGISQLACVEAFVLRRNEIARVYGDALEGVSLTLPDVPSDCYSAFHLYIVRLQRDSLQGTHRAIFEALRAAGVGVNLHYIPIYKQPYFQTLGSVFSPCPNAEAYYNEAISIPMFPALTDEEQKSVIDALKRVVL